MEDQKQSSSEVQPDDIAPDAGDVRGGVDHRLLAFADAHHLVITSGTGGRHNIGSKHYRGLAIDVRSRGVNDEQVQQLAWAAHTAGLLLRDERLRPPHQTVWGGPHLHIEVA